MGTTMLLCCHILPRLLFPTRSMLQQVVEAQDQQLEGLLGEVLEAEEQQQLGQLVEAEQH